MAGMASPEQKAQKQEYSIVDFYCELARLQKEGDFKEINLDDLDESDIELYLIFKKTMIDLNFFDSSINKNDLKFRREIQISPNQPNIKDMIKKRRYDLALKGGRQAQMLFCDTISRKIDEAYGF